MANLPWLDEVRQRLAKHTLPPAYIRRFTEELADHFQDITEDTMSTEASALSRLGEPKQVADAAVALIGGGVFWADTPRRRSWYLAFRQLCHCFFCYLRYSRFSRSCRMMIPPWMPLGTWDRADKRQPPYMLSVLFPILPCILVSVLHCKVARGLGLGRKWMVLSCTVLAVLAGAFMWSATFSQTPGRSSSRLGIGIPCDILDLPKMAACIFRDPLRLAQFAVPLAIGCWFLRRKGDEARLQLAS